MYKHNAKAPVFKDLENLNEKLEKFLVSKSSRLSAEECDLIHDCCTRLRKVLEGKSSRFENDICEIFELLLKFFGSVSEIIEFIKEF